MFPRGLLVRHLQHRQLTWFIFMKSQKANSCHVSDSFQHSAPSALTTSYETNIVIWQLSTWIKQNSRSEKFLALNRGQTCQVIFGYDTNSCKVLWWILVMNIFRYVTLQCQHVQFLSSHKSLPSRCETEQSQTCISVKMYLPKRFLTALGPKRPR